MADKSLMTPSTVSLSGLLGNGITYKVPIFQRDYSWKIDNWTDLLEDIKLLLSTGKDHYIVDNRQNDLARKATSIWKIQYAD